MSKRLILLVLLMALVVAACGDDDSPFVAPDSDGFTATTRGGGDGSGGGGLSDPADVAMAEDISSTLQGAIAEIGAEPGPLGEMDILGPAEADCIAEGMVRAFGADRLAELGLPPDDLADSGDLDFLGEATPSEVNAAIDVLLGCVDARPLVVEALTELGISAGSAGCLADEILAPGVIGGLVGTVMSAAESTEDPSSLIEDPAIIGPIMQMLNTCLTPEELGGLLGGLGDLGDLGILGG